MIRQEKYFISVSEPWDFKSSDGQNIVGGTILNIKSNRCLVFKGNHYLKFGTIEGNILLLTPRHHSNDFLDLTKLVVVNGSLLLKGYEDSLKEKQLLENAEFVIVGSIRKE